MKLPGLRTCAALTILFSYVSGGVFAQSTEPDEPGIVLPPVFLEIEDLSEETIEAVLPEFDADILPEPTLALPDAGELALSDDLFDVEAPDQPGGGISVGNTAGGSSIYSEGTIGIGTQNALIGDLSLYKLGPEPRFTMSFLHESVDGYGARTAGTDYHHSEDALDGSFEFSRDPVTFGFSAELEARELGLQDVGTTYNSVDHRFLSGDLSTTITPRESISVDLNVDVSSATQVLSADTPRINSEFGVSPNVGVAAVMGIVTLSLNTSYALDISDVMATALHSGDADAGIVVELPFGLDIGIYGGAVWDNSYGFGFPFNATLDGTLGRFLGFRLDGGYRHQRRRLYDTWMDYPLAELAFSAPEFGWYFDTDLQWSFWDSLVLGTGIEFSIMSQTLVRNTTPDPVSGLFDLVLQTDKSFLSPVVDLTWRPTEQWSLTGMWQAQLFESDGLSPTLQFAVEGAYVSGNGDFGVTGAMAIDSYEIIQLPDVDLSGFYRIADGVTIDIMARDIISLATNDERTTWGPYVSPGFQVILATRISL